MNIKDMRDLTHDIDNNEVIELKKKDIYDFFSMLVGHIFSRCFNMLMRIWDKKTLEEIENNSDFDEALTCLLRLFIDDFVEESKFLSTNELIKRYNNFIEKSKLDFNKKTTELRIFFNVDDI